MIYRHVLKHEKSAIHKIYFENEEKISIDFFIICEIIAKNSLYLSGKPKLSCSSSPVPNLNKMTEKL